MVVQILRTPYFAQVKPTSMSDLVQFSFTALTTTGFGGRTPATRVGAALAVLEMVTGKITR